MLDKLKANKGKIIGHFSAAIGAGVLAGAVATAASEQLGYGALALYIYALFGHSRIVSYIEKNVK